MQYGIDALVIVNGKDKTDSIVSCNCMDCDEQLLLVG